MAFWQCPEYASELRLEITDMKLIYLDVCALCRPFDDQRFVRVHLESEAVKLILQKVRDGHIQLMTSPVHFAEINALPDMVERIELLGILQGLGKPMKANSDLLRKRADELVGKAFGIADAAHFACAEAMGADFISCDDKLIKRSAKLKNTIWSGDPLAFCIKENLK